MSRHDFLNAVQLIKTGLEHQIRDRLEQEVMNEMFEYFKKKAEPIIKEQVNRLTLEGVDCYRDMEAIRDELRVLIDWNGDEYEVKK
jgi:hypothetical protein